VVIGANETIRVRYRDENPDVESRSRTPRKRGSSTGSRGPGRSTSQVSRVKREEREKRQRSARRKRWALGFLAVAVLIGAAIGLSSLYRSDTFKITTVRVGGADRLEAQRVREIAGVPPEETLLRIDTAAVESRLMSDPWISAARVERDFPDAVVVTIRERTPRATVAVGGGKRWLLASDGVWLGPRSKDATPTFVLIRDVKGLKPVAGGSAESDEVKNALEVVDGLSPELRKIVVAVSAPSIDRTALRTKNKIEIFVGSSEDIAKKDEIARRILAEQGENAVYINVRTIDRPTWRGLKEDL
jgi:cell division protein FtsQ